MKYTANYPKYAVALLFIMGASAAQAQENTAETVRPMYEKLGVSPTLLASIMIIFTALLVGFVISLSGSVKNMVEYKRSKLNDKLKMVLVLVGIFATQVSFAAGENTATEYAIPFPDEAFWAFLTFDIALVMIILYYTGIMRGIISEYSVPIRFNVFARWKKKMTDSVPIEDEHTIMLDHDYDGIRELDNNLPPWWKYGFYLTIGWSVIYLFYYHILQAGPLQEEEYITEMLNGEREVAEYKKAHPVLITADNVTILTDDASIQKGQEVYTTYCQTCHMEKGRGGAGPNLTDNTWIYGSSIKTVFTTISEGTKNGMAKWSDIIKAEEIQAVASFVLQLESVLPPEGKLPEGTITE